MSSLPAVSLDHLSPVAVDKWSKCIRTLAEFGAKPNILQTFRGVYLADSLRASEDLGMGESVFVEGLLERLGKEDALGGTGGAGGGKLCELVLTISKIGRPCAQGMDRYIHACWLLCLSASKIGYFLETWIKGAC